MSNKRIDLNRSVHALCTQYPELISILVEIGFSDIAKPGMLETVGRFMTIPKGAALKKLDISAIQAHLAENGFIVTKEEEKE